MTKETEDGINAFEKKLDGMSIDKIEAGAFGALKKATKNRELLIMSLFYLQRSSRYKENKRYKTASFELYLKDHFRMTMSAYMEERIAFVNFGKEVAKHGLDTVIKIRSKCGTDKIEKVCSALSKIEKSNRAGIVSIEKEAELIKRFEKSKPEQDKKDLTTLSYPMLRSEVQALRDRVLAQDAYILELEEQRDRLIKTVETLKAANDVIFGRGSSQ